MTGTTGASSIGGSVAEAGEVALITAVTDGLPTTAAVLLGPGDDAAVLAATAAALPTSVWIKM